MDTDTPPPLLVGHTLVDTGNPEEARHEIGRIFCPHFLSPRVSRAEGFHAVHRSVRQSFHSLNFVSYGCEVDIDPGELSRFFLLQIPVAGSASVRCGTQTALVSPGRVASLLSPTLPTRMRWSGGCAKLIVLIEREAMESRWEVMAQRRVGPVEFATAIDLAGPAGRVLMKHVRLMIDSVEAGGISDHYRLRLGEDLAFLLLSSFAHSQRALLEQPAQAVCSAAVVRAEEWIRANIARPFSVAEVAEASGTGLRSLQHGIRRDRGTTLTRLIETIRLEVFRAALADPRNRGSVTESAFSSGLGHLGRAATAYRKRYGETPSQTVRRLQRGRAVLGS